MRIEHLFEAGIRTAQLDTLARRAVAKALASQTDAILKAVEPKLPPARPSRSTDEWERESEERSDLYDRLYDYARARPEEFLKPFCAAIQSTLQTLTQGYADSVFEAIPGMPERLRRLGYQSVNNAIGRHIRVEIEPREESNDAMASQARGYFQDWNSLIKVFINQDDLHQALWGFVNEKLMGEDPEDGLGNILRVIIPTFLHEYAHYEQAMRSLLTRMDRGVTKPTTDFTYITPKNLAGDRKGKGQRGGSARMATDDPGEWERYLGSEHEIDSWATSAASKMLDDLQQEVRHTENWRTKSPCDWNAEIRDIQRNLAQGYIRHSNDSFSAYDKLAHDAFKGWYDTVDSSEDEWDRQDKQDGYDPANRVVIPRDQIEKVRKIFYKKVAARLGDYMRSEDPNGDPAYQAAMTDRTMAKGVMALARLVAKRINDANDPYANRKEKILSGYAPEVEKAESYLHDRLFANKQPSGFTKLGRDPDEEQPYRSRWDDPAAERTMELFRKAVLHDLARLDPEWYGADQIAA